MIRTLLTDEIRKKVEAILPGNEGDRRRMVGDDRWFLDAMLWIDWNRSLWRKICTESNGAIRAVIGCSSFFRISDPSHSKARIFAKIKNLKFEACERGRQGIRFHLEMYGNRHAGLILNPLYLRNLYVTVK
jgi:hypothetical protein